MQDAERRWCAAELERCRFVLAANKADLPGHASLLERLAPYRALGYAVTAMTMRKSLQAD